MSIDYFKESEKYKPQKVKTLLVGEAPPPSGNSYFYVPKPMSNIKPIRQDRSLPATIFYHYFQTRPETEVEYVRLLQKLKDKEVFLIDISDEPLRIRERNGINQMNLERLVAEIPKLRNKIRSRDIFIKDEKIIFLLPRPHYKRYLVDEFPASKCVQWIDFRMAHE